MSHLPNLQTLTLPTSLASAADYALVRAPLHPMTPPSCALNTPFTKSFLSARRAAISRDACLERDVINELFEPIAKYTRAERNGNGVISHLQSVAFVRQVHEEDRLEYAVEYGRGTGAGDVTVRVLRPTGEEAIVPVTAVDVSDPDDVDFDSVEGDEEMMDVDAPADEMVSLWGPIHSLPWSSFEPLSDPATQLANAARKLASHNQYSTCI